MRPAIQFLDGEILIDSDSDSDSRVITMRASHNTICVQFGIDDAKYVHLNKVSE